MTDYGITELHSATLFTGKKRRPSFGRRLILWIETHQQRKADREIAQILRRTRR